jgi:hypothetical protein
MTSMLMLPSPLMLRALESALTLFRRDESVSLANGAGKAFKDAADAGLWISPRLIPWRSQPAKYSAQIAIEGASAENECRLALIVPRRAGLNGSLSILWNNIRVRGFDLDGSPHVDPRSGQRIPTPHWQALDENDREVVEAISLDRQNITSLEIAVRWFLSRSGVRWQSAWVDPPLQVQLTRRTPMPRSLRRRRG